MSDTLKTAEFLKRQARVARHERRVLRALTKVTPQEAHRMLAKVSRLQRWRWS